MSRLNLPKECKVKTTTIEKVSIECSSEHREQVYLQLREQGFVVEKMAGRMSDNHTFVTIEASRPLTDRK